MNGALKRVRAPYVSGGSITSTFEKAFLVIGKTGMRWVFVAGRLCRGRCHLRGIPAASTLPWTLVGMLRGPGLNRAKRKRRLPPIPRGFLPWRGSMAWLRGCVPEDLLCPTLTTSPSPSPADSASASASLTPAAPGRIQAPVRPRPLLLLLLLPVLPPSTALATRPRHIPAPKSPTAPTRCPSSSAP